MVPHGKVMLACEMSFVKFIGSTSARVQLGLPPLKWKTLWLWPHCHNLGMNYERKLLCMHNSAI
jgi:hypothetical protein